MRRSTALVTLALSLCQGACSDEETRAVQAIPACDFEYDFVAPDPAYPWTPNAVKLTSVRLADNAFAIVDENAETYPDQGRPVATSGGFVIGADGVLMIETMINRQLFCQAVDLIRAETTKPITHAINTSHHGDHMYGNTFLPDDVTIIQHANTAAFVAAHFEEDVAWMEQNFGADQGLDEVRPRAADVRVGASGHVIDLGGGVRVEARYQGFGQTDGDLFVYSPDANTLWTGNPLVATAPAIPWLLDGHAVEVRATLAAVRDSVPSDARVVPGHAGVRGVEAFDFSIAYLDALIAGVQASVDAGRSLEETVEAVALEAFQGYALWGWLHVTVNVPATYAELSAAR